MLLYWFWTSPFIQTKLWSWQKCSCVSLRGRELKTKATSRKMSCRLKIWKFNCINLHYYKDNSNSLWQSQFPNSTRAETQTQIQPVGWGFRCTTQCHSFQRIWIYLSTETLPALTPREGFYDEAWEPSGRGALPMRCRPPVLSHQLWVLWEDTHLQPRTGTRDGPGWDTPEPNQNETFTVSVSLIYILQCMLLIADSTNGRQICVGCKKGFFSEVNSAGQCKPWTK